MKSQRSEGKRDLKLLKGLKDNNAQVQEFLSEYMHGDEAVP